MYMVGVTMTAGHFEKNCQDQICSFFSTTTHSLQACDPSNEIYENANVMKQPWLLLLLFLSCLVAVPSSSATAADGAADDEQPLVCIVIRTYYGHGTYGDSSLINLLHSLKQQTHPRSVHHPPKYRYICHSTEVTGTLQHSRAVECCISLPALPVSAQMAGAAAGDGQQAIP